MSKLCSVAGASLCLLLAVVAGCATTPDPQAPPFPVPVAELTRTTPRAEAFGHYLMSIVRQRAGQLNESLAELELAAALAPEPEPILRRLAIIYGLAGEYEKAAQYAEQAVDITPDDPVLWIQLGTYLQKLEQYEAATKAFDKALSLEPDNVLEYTALVRAESDANDLVAVIDIYRKLIELHPEMAVFHLNLAKSLTRINDYEAAYSEIQKALELNPADQDALYVGGILALELEKPEEAERLLRAFLDAAPDDIAAQEHLAAALARQGRRDAALETFAAIIESGEGQPLHWLARMYLLLRMDRPADAEALVPPTGAPILGTLLRAWAREDAGQPHTVLLETLDEVEGELEQEYGDFMSQLVFLFGKADVAPYALDRLARNAEAVSASRRLFDMLGRIQISLDQADAARESFLKALTITPEDRSIHFALATLYYEEFKDIAAAEKHLLACIALDPGDADAMNFLGYMYADENIKLEEAEQLVQRALAVDPDNPYYLDSMGWVYYRQGNAKQAVTYIQRAIWLMDHDDAILRDHLGDAYLLNGETERAVAQWERALRLDPELEGVQGKLENHRASAGTP